MKPEMTSITYRSPGGREIGFTVLHQRPEGFYVVCPGDEDKIVHGSYQYGDCEELLEMLTQMLSDLSVLVDSMTDSISRTVDLRDKSGTVFYSCGYVKEKGQRNTLNTCPFKAM